MGFFNNQQIYIDDETPTLINYRKSQPIEGEENSLSNRQYVPFQKQKSIINQSVSTATNKKLGPLEAREPVIRLPTPENDAFRSKRKSMGEDNYNSPRFAGNVMTDSVVITGEGN
jgi:hypothetical protein